MKKLSIDKSLQQFFPVSEQKWTKMKIIKYIEFLSLSLEFDNNQNN